MKLSDGIEQYVVGKHASGLGFEKGESSLTAFFRQVGDVDLGQVKTQQVLTYLNGSETGPITWRLKYRILFRFFDFWFLAEQCLSCSCPRPERRCVKPSFRMFTPERSSEPS